MYSQTILIIERYCTDNMDYRRVVSVPASTQGSLDRHTYVYYDVGDSSRNIRYHVDNLLQNEPKLDSKRFRFVRYGALQFVMVSFHKQVVKKSFLVQSLLSVCKPNYHYMFTLLQSH